MKKYLKILILTLLLSVIVCAAAYADIFCGYCGEKTDDDPDGTSVTWILDENTGVLKFTARGDHEPKIVCGTGNYSNNTSPWGAHYEKITSIEVGDGITAIAPYSFALFDRVKKVKLPEGLVSIGEGAFLCETALTDINLPDSVEDIGTVAFYSCPRVKLNGLPKSLKSIGINTFYECENFTGTLVIPEGVTVLPTAAFLHTGIEKVVLHDKVTELADSVFSYCRCLEEIYIPAGVKRIGYLAFGNSGLKKFTFDEDCDLVINGNIFRSTYITELVIPKNVRFESIRLLDMTTIHTLVFEDDEADLVYSDFVEGTVSIKHICVRENSKAYKHFEEYRKGMFTYYTEETKQVREAGCTSKALTRTYCKICGRVMSEEETGGPLGHEWDTTGTGSLPTCVKQGRMVYKCTREGCKETNTVTMDALGHDYIKDENNSKEPTCKEDGLYTMVCSRCNSTVTVTVNKLDTHTFDGGVITLEPTYEKEGEKTYTCTVCGFTKTEPIDILTPTVTPIPDITPTPAPTPTPMPRPTYTPVPKAKIPASAAALTVEKQVIYLHKNVNAEQEVTLRISPENADIKSIEWKLNKKGIIKMTPENDSMSAKVSAVKKGKAVITVTVNDKSGNELNASAEITVKKSKKKIKSIKFSDKKLTLKIGDELIPEFSYRPIEAYNDTLKWKSSNKNVVKVSKDGTLKALKKGSAVITVTTINGKKATIKVRVKQ